VTVRESGSEVIFLRKVVEGACDSSYGIQVAKMAGVPERVVRRAWQILDELEGGSLSSTFSLSKGKNGMRVAAESQVDLFSPSTPSYQPNEGRQVIPVENPVHREMFDAVMGLDINALTPLEILFKIAEAQRKARGETP
jgi:DNA mismatch repair protein MutS